jgi:hypothetical protein
MGRSLEEDPIGKPNPARAFPHLGSLSRQVHWIHDDLHYLKQAEQPNRPQRTRIWPGWLPLRHLLRVQCLEIKPE